MTDQDALNRIAALPAQGVDASLIERARKLADDMERHATDEWDESELVRALIAALAPASGGVEAPAEDAAAKGETAGEMLDRLGMDGAKWAAEFRTTALRLGYSDMDEGWLIGWFCNAIMAGYDRAPTAAPVDALVKAEFAEARRTYSGFGHCQEALKYAESMVLAALAAYRGGAK